MGLPPIDRAAMLAEVEREIEQRRRLYPGWVSKNRLSLDESARRIAVMSAVATFLREAPETPAAAQRQSAVGLGELGRLTSAVGDRLAQAGLAITRFGVRVAPDTVIHADIAATGSLDERIQATVDALRRAYARARDMRRAAADAGMVEPLGAPRDEPLMHPDDEEAQTAA